MEAQARRGASQRQERALWEELERRRQIRDALAPYSPAWDAASEAVLELERRLRAPGPTRPDRRC